MGGGGKAMKTFLLFISLTFLMVFGTVSFLKNNQKPTHPYTVYIIQGNTYMSYTSEIQIDSFKWVLNGQFTKVATVYKNGQNMVLKADMIYFKKNK